MKQNILFTLLLVFPFIACVKQEDRGDQKKPTGEILDVVMHRGVTINNVAPENSLDAIALVSRVGATTVEFDIMHTLDEEILILHDDEIGNRCFRNAKDYSLIADSVAPSSLTLKEIQERYVFASPNPAMRRQIPTLLEGLTLCKQKNIYPIIEIKTPSNNKMAKKAYDIAVEVLGKGNFGITCFSLPIIEYLRKIDNDLSLAYDFEQNPITLQRLRLNYYRNDGKILDHNVLAVHQKGVRAFAWIIPKERYDILLEQKIDGILSDDIAPMYKREYSIYTDYTDGAFKNYSHNGILKQNILHLNKDQKLELKETNADSLYLGALYFDVEFKGKIRIEANGFSVDRESKGNDYKRVPFQFLLHNQKPFFNIIALDDSVQIKSVWLAINKF